MGDRLNEYCFRLKCFNAREAKRDLEMKAPGEGKGLRFQHPLTRRSPSFHGRLRNGLRLKRI